MSNESLKMLAAEFKLWGVAMSTTRIGSGHVEISWQVSEYKDKRSYVVPNSPSDSRGWMNARADIRRMFRADGLSLKEKEKERPSKLEKALSLPVPQETVQDHILLLRAEVADLTDLTLELAVAVRDLCKPVEEAVVPSVDWLKLKAGVFDYVSENEWTHTAEIARKMNLPKETVYQRLYYARKNGRVELSNGKWRKISARPQLVRSN